MAGGLFVALEKWDAEVRPRAVEALPGPGARANEAIPALVRLLEDADEMVGEAAGEALRDYGAVATEALLDAFHDPSERRRVQRRGRAIWVLAQRAGEGNEAVEVAIARGLLDRSEDVRVLAVLGLCQTGERMRPYVADVARLLADEDENLARLVAGAVWFLGDEGQDLVPGLLRALKRGEALRDAAVETLGEVGRNDPRVARALLELFTGPARGSWWYALPEALGKHRSEDGVKRIVAALVEVLRGEGREEVRGAACYALRGLGPRATAAAAMLVEMLRARQGSNRFLWTAYQARKAISEEAGQAFQGDSSAGQP